MTRTALSILLALSLASAALAQQPLQAGGLKLQPAVQLPLRASAAADPSLLQSATLIVKAGKEAGAYGRQIESSEDTLYKVGNINTAGDATGFDIIEFQFCANPGEGLKPLAKIASGGEISRVMLALKNAFLRKRGGACEVFDEIDVGISGDVAAKVARQLKELAKKHQVICITHLAQIASLGDRHFRVYKDARKGRSVTRVQLLDRDERVKEIASLISGEKISPRAMAGAEELLRDAKKEQ